MDATHPQAAPRYVQLWPKETELCPVCGQPDNCGDCDHTPLPMDEVVELGGELMPLMPTDRE